ncbi:hypothetical protein ACP4J4_08460 [Aureimonas ureilytica]|uniref:hypothetical protein n=1 Tax=Aureimonas ureilytica TaxID=401562 RepID=UPI003CF91376
MPLRLAIVCSLFALFAFGFSELVESKQRVPGIGVASAGCLDRGMVCVKSPAD